MTGPDSEGRDKEAVYRMSDDVIRFIAQIAQVRTMADGGLRVVLDFDEINIEAATALMQVKRAGEALVVAAVAIVPEKEKQWRDPIN